MKKKILVLSLPLLLVVSAITAWFHMQGRDAARNAVAADAVAVAMFDARQLARGLGFEDKDLVDFYSRHENTILPIDLSKPVYAFVSPEGFLCLALNLHNSDGIQDNPLFADFTFQEQDGVHWMSSKNYVGVCSEDKLLLCKTESETSPRILRRYISALLRQDRQEVALLDTLRKHEGFFRLAVSLAHFPANILPFQIPRGTFPADAALTAALNVQQKKISLHINTQSEAMSLPLFPTSTDMGEALPAGTAMWLQTNTKGESLLPSLRRVPTLRSALLALNMCIDADMILRAIDGDIFLACTLERPLSPDFLFIAELKDTCFLDASAQWSGVVRCGPADFIISHDNSDVYFGVRNKYIYICSREDMTQNLPRFRWGKNPSRKCLSAMFYLDALTSHPAFAQLSAAVPAVGDALHSLKHVSLGADNPSNIEFSLTTRKPIKEILLPFIQQ